MIFTFFGSPSFFCFSNRGIFLLSSTKTHLPINRPYERKFKCVRTAHFRSKVVCPRTWKEKSGQVHPSHLLVWRQYRPLPSITFCYFRLQIALLQNCLVPRVCQKVRLRLHCSARCSEPWMRPASTQQPVYLLLISSLMIWFYKWHSPVFTGKLDKSWWFQTKVWYHSNQVGVKSDEWPLFNLLLFLMSFSGLMSLDLLLFLFLGFLSCADSFFCYTITTLCHLFYLYVHPCFIFLYLLDSVYGSLIGIPKVLLV